MWSDFVVNRYLAPELSTFNSAEIPELQLQGEKVEHWLTNHFLNSVFRAEFAPTTRQLVFNLIYRAQAACEAYEDAATRTKHFLASSTPGEPKSLLYYRALRAWEQCFLNLQVFSDVLRRLSKKNVFDANDGTPEQRAYSIANVIKHWGQVVARGEHEPDDTLPMWLTNVGFKTKQVYLSYAELATLFVSVAVVVEHFRDPFAHVAPPADA
jgi:hypothetical protein